MDAEATRRLRAELLAKVASAEYAGPGEISVADLFMPGRSMLGRGTSGAVVPGVYIDSETGRNHLVAIKILERTTNDDEGVYNFQRERDALAGRTVSRARKSRPMSESGRPATEVEGTFSHPCIVRYYGYALALW